jgi:prepilin-type processing-associated H-X9-DG protein
MGFDRSDGLAGQAHPNEILGHDLIYSDHWALAIARVKMYCPNDPRPHAADGQSNHWRSFYFPKPETIRNPNGAVYVGDTNNAPYVTPDGSGMYDNWAGCWEHMPGWGQGEYGGMGFDRHGDRMMIGYADGHGGSITRSEVLDTGKYPRHDYFVPTSAFTVQTIGDDGCGGTDVHPQPPSACGSL